MHNRAPLGVTGCLAGDLLAEIMHHVARFFTSGERMRVGDPIGWIGLGQFAVQRVWG